MRRAPLLVAIAILLAGCGERGSIGGLLILEGSHAIERGTTLSGDLFVLDGGVELEVGARITGSAYVLGGRVLIAGQVDGDVAVVGGEVRLTDDAVITGGLRRGGGAVEVADGASVGSELVSPVAVDAIIGLTGPPSEPQGPTPWILAQLAVLGLLAAVAARLARRSVDRMADGVRVQPMVPLAVGVLGLIVGLSLLVFMIFTVVLIPVALLMAIGGVVGAGLGGVSLGLLAVRLRLGPASLGGHASAQAAIGSVAIAVVVLLVSRIPLIGEATVAVVAATALGAWLVTRFGTRDMPVEPR